jgi:hypothetical protein
LRDQMFILESSLPVTKVSADSFMASPFIQSL